MMKCCFILWFFFVPTLHTELFTNVHSVVAASHHTPLKLLLNSHLLLILYSWIMWLLWLKSVICTLLCDALNTHYKTEKNVSKQTSSKITICHCHQCQRSAAHCGWMAMIRQERGTWSPYLSCWRLSQVKCAEIQSESKPRHQVE